MVVRLEPGKMRAWDFVDEIAPDADVPVFPANDARTRR
jgi:hypothetical protein